VTQPFDYFRKVGDVPGLEAWEHNNPDLVYVVWHNDRMWGDDRGQFEAAVAADEMNAALHAIWNRHRHQYTRRTKFSTEDVTGHITYAPIDVGMAMYEIVRAHFTRALYEIHKVKLKQRKLRKIEKRLRAKLAAEPRLSDMPDHTKSEARHA
jgi:hypothetical protein